MMKQTVRAAQVVRGIQIKDADLINLLSKEIINKNSNYTGD